MLSIVVYSSTSLTKVVSDAIFPARHPKKSSQWIRACPARDGAICSENRKIVPYDRRARIPTRRAGRLYVPVCLRSPAPIMAPDLYQCAIRVPWYNCWVLYFNCQKEGCSGKFQHCILSYQNQLCVTMSEKIGSLSKPLLSLSSVALHFWTLFSEQENYRILWELLML